MNSMNSTSQRYQHNTIRTNSDIRECLQAKYKNKKWSTDEDSDNDTRGRCGSKSAQSNYESVLASKLHFLCTHKHAYEHMILNVYASIHDLFIYAKICFSVHACRHV